jgi:4-amino-4-deoxy-L-arabinose transferase-like glycosyltransferase
MAVLLLTVAVAAFFRLYRLDAIPPGLYADEAIDANDALLAWRSGDFRVFYPENNGREGLVINVQAVVLGLIGQSRPWVVRLPGALFGTLAVGGLYLLAKQLGLPRTAWLAAWLLAASFWHIGVSRFGTRVVAAPFFLVWALWLWGEAGKSARHWWLWAMGAGLMYGLGFHTYPAYRLTPLLLLCLVGRYPIKVSAIATAMAALVILPLAIYALRQPEIFLHRWHDLPSLTVHDLVANTVRMLGMFNFAGDANPRHNLTGRAMLWWPVGLLFLVGAVIAARRQRVLLAWLVVGVVPAILANEGVPHSWRAVLAAPAAFLLAALGMEWLTERYRRRWLAPVLAAVVAIESANSYFRVWARDPHVAEWCDSSLMNVAAELDALPRELPKYVILDPDPMVVRGLPAAAQTIMFLTDTATADRQEAKNLHYLWPDQTNQIARGYVAVYHIETTRP